MSRRKKGFIECCFKKSLGKSIENNSMARNLKFGIERYQNISFSSNKSQQVLDSSFSSNTPGFIGVKINKGIDDNRLKGGFRKL